LGSVAPYGYKKSETVKNKLEIDKTTAYVVEEIFNLYSIGYGFQKISTYLDKKKIPPPSKYLNQKNYISAWNPKSIRAILINEAYIGNTVQNKCISISYKIKKRKPKNESEYIRVENTHEAIISKKVFYQVQDIIKKKRTTSSTRHDFLFKGLIFCHNCGRKSRVCFRGIKKKTGYIDCSLARGKEKKCPPQNYNYDKFEDRVLNVIREVCKIYADKKTLKAIYENYKNNYVCVIKKEEKNMKEIDSRVEVLTKKIDKIYFDNLNGVITDLDYIRYSKGLAEEKEELLKRKMDIQKKINSIKTPDVKNDNADKIIEEFMLLKKPTRKLLYELIEKIEIAENKTIYIYFSFSELNLINERL